MARLFLLIDARLLLVFFATLFLASSYPEYLVSCGSTQDIVSHTDLNSFFPSPPAFFTTVRLASLQNPNFSPQILNSTVYAHDESPGSAAAAIQSALSIGYDIITLDVSCSQVQADLALAAAVSDARRGGTVVLCRPGPTPVFVEMVPGGVNVSVTLTNTGGQGGATYTSRVYEAASDLQVIVPEILVFQTADQIKAVTLAVFIKNNSGDGGRRNGGFRWREAHIDWVSAAHPAIERVLIIKQAI